MTFTFRDLHNVVVDRGWIGAGEVDMAFGEVTIHFVHDTHPVRDGWDWVGVVKFIDHNKTFRHNGDARRALVINVDAANNRVVLVTRDQDLNNWDIPNHADQWFTMTLDAPLAAPFRTDTGTKALDFLVVNDLIRAITNDLHVQLQTDDMGLIV